MFLRLMYFCPIVFYIGCILTNGIVFKVEGGKEESNALCCAAKTEVDEYKSSLSSESECPLLRKCCLLYTSDAADE